MNMTMSCAKQSDAQVRSDVRQITPRANIYGEADKVYVEIELPGVKKEDVHMSVENSQLHLDAKRYGKGEGEVPEPLFEYRRDFNLASNLDVDSIAAQYENGVLRLELTRKETGRVIPVV